MLSGVQSILSIVLKRVLFKKEARVPCLEYGVISDEVLANYIEIIECG